MRTNDDRPDHIPLQGPPRTPGSRVLGQIWFDELKTACADEQRGSGVLLDSIDSTLWIASLFRTRDLQETLDGPAGVLLEFCFILICITSTIQT